MSATSAGSAAGRMRASDADRDATLAQLSEHFQAGRLTQDEFEERSGQALTARTMGELGDLMTDLPRPAGSGLPISGPAGFDPAASDPTASGRTGLDPAAGAPPVPWVRPALVPVIVVLAVLGSVVTLGTHHHGWTFWWIIPLVLIVARRLASRRMAGRPGPFGQR